MLGRAIALVIVVLFAGASSLGAIEQPAKVMFGMTSTPAPMQARAIGSYARGCLAGGVQLPVNGPAWQAMRLSRNRTWGHPLLVKFVEQLAVEAHEKDGWPGLLVGDLAQPRGGPMLTGHASHQIGLDADIWLTAMPGRTLSNKEREEKAAISVLAEDGFSVDPAKWTLGHTKLLRRAALSSQVARIFVHPAIKKQLCDTAAEVDADVDWLKRVRPWYGHHYHFHVRLGCPAGMAGCENQTPLPAGDGCGKEVDDWLALVRPKKEVTPPVPGVQAKKKKKKKAPLTLAQLPAECATVLAAGFPDGLKRFKIDLAADITPPARNPRRLAAVASTTTAANGSAQAQATPVPPSPQ